MSTERFGWDCRNWRRTRLNDKSIGFSADILCHEATKPLSTRHAFPIAGSAVAVTLGLCPAQGPSNPGAPQFCKTLGRMLHPQTPRLIRKQSLLLPPRDTCSLLLPRTSKDIGTLLASMKESQAKN